MDTTIAVIGGGPAGLEAAATLAELGISVMVLEKTECLGGKVLNWKKLFPVFRDAGEIVAALTGRLDAKNVTFFLNTEVIALCQHNGGFKLTLANGKTLEANCVLLATGYELFEAGRKEEYGYGIYDHVITSVDLERLFKEGALLSRFDGVIPQRVAFIHCVGSRDEKAGNLYCSKVCCITGVKQAIEMRQELPGAEIFCFYTDLRMYGKGFEGIYREAQERWGIQFIRGRVSEAAETIAGRIQIKAEDTLSSRPLKMDVDMLVLLIGMIPPKRGFLVDNLPLSHDGFLGVKDVHLRPNETIIPGLFLAGAVTSPKSVYDTIIDAKAAAATIAAYLKQRPRA